MTMAVITASTRPVASFGTPKAPTMASAIELACTALKTRPKDRIRQTENTDPSHGIPRPLAM